MISVIVLYDVNHPWIHCLTRHLWSQTRRVIGHLCGPVVMDMVIGLSRINQLT